MSDVVTHHNNSNDITLSDVYAVKKDVMASFSETDLQLNMEKCEIIMEVFTEINTKDFITC